MSQVKVTLRRNPKPTANFIRYDNPDAQNTGVMNNAYIAKADLRPNAEDPDDPKSYPPSVEITVNWED